MAKKNIRHSETTNALAKLINEVSARGGHTRWDVFRDFVTCSAICFMQTVNKAVRNELDQKLEDEYLGIINTYDKPNRMKFSEMLAVLVEELHAAPSDVLGNLFSELDLGDSWKGQFFTPDHLSLMMGQINCMDIDERLKEQEFFTVCEPAVGSGTMIIGIYNAMLEKNINPQAVMHVVATDVDRLAAMMAYVQFTLLNIPAYVVHGNTISGKTWAVWPTLAHVMGFWDYKLKRHYAAQQEDTPNQSEAAPSAEIKPTTFEVTKQEEVAPTIRPAVKADYRATEQISLFDMFNK